MIRSVLVCTYLNLLKVKLKGRKEGAETRSLSFCLENLVKFLPGFGQIQSGRGQKKWAFDENLELDILRILSSGQKKWAFGQILKKKWAEKFGEKSSKSG